MTADGGASSVARVAVPEIRDYERINAEVVQRLDEGYRRVRLDGAEAQRFLVAGLSGSWEAVVEVGGHAGPELAAGLNAPGLTVVCHGAAGDGAGRGLRAGRVLIVGAAAEGLGYAQEGGTIVALSTAGHRAGLNQRGGVLAVLGQVGRLAGERQCGGWFFAYDRLVGPFAGRGRRGGRFVRLISADDPLSGIDPADADVFAQLARDLGRWTPTGWAGVRGLVEP